MNKQGLITALIGFIFGLILAFSTGIINDNIQEKNRIQTQRINLISDFSELQAQFTKIKNTIREGTNCEILSEQYADLISPSLKIIGNEQSTIKQKIVFFGMLQQIDFIRTNICNISKEIDLKNNKYEIYVEDQKLNGYLFEGNINKIDSQLAIINIEILLK